MTEDATLGPVGSHAGLGPPAQPLRYYCNKCGHMGEQGPEHDVCAGYPQQRCNYTAVAWGPFWSTEQLAASVAAERERCALLCEAEHVLERLDAEDGHPCDLSYNQALRDAAAAIRGPNVL